MHDFAEEQGWRRPIAIASGFVLIALFILAGAIGVAAAVALTAILAIPPWPRLKTVLPLELPLAIFLIFIAWAWASMRWSTYPQTEQGWKMALGVMLYSLFAFSVWSLQGKARLLVLYAATASLAMIILLYLIEASFGIFSGMYAEGAVRQEKLRDATRGVSALIMATPCAWAFASIFLPGWQGKAFGAFIGLIAFWIAWQFSLSSAMLAIMIAGIFFGLGWAFPRTTILFTGLAALGAFMLAPMVIPVIIDVFEGSNLPLSWEQRLDIWKFTSERISEKPLIGWGLDASRTFNSTYTLRGFEFPRISMHPHNFGLQLWLETGLIGVMLFSAATLTFAIRVSNSQNLTRLQGAAISGSSAAILVFANLSYGAWQEWFWASIAWIAAMCFLLGPAPKRRTKN